MANRHIFIGYDGSGCAISILLAESRRDADTFWQGANIFPHTVREVDPMNPGNEPFTVLPLLKTKTHTCRVPGAGSEEVVRVDP